MYEAFYRFTAKPFRLSPDYRFFFRSRGHKRALSYLQYGINQGEGFIVVTGDVGTGKTTLVQTLLNTFVNDDLVAAKLVTTQLEADDMLRMVSAVFGLPHEGVSKAGLLKNIEGFLERYAWQDKRVLLIVDEAQNLPRKSLEELRMLSNIQTAGVPLLQTFLLGQKEFLGQLQAEDMEQLRQRIIASYHLKALDSDEIGAYIEHRLGLVGWSGDPAFTAEAYGEIYALTGGVPRRINTLCDRLLLFGYLEGLHTFDDGVIRTVAEELAGEIMGAAGGAGPGEGAASADRAPLERRIAALEEKVNELEDALILERARLRALALNNK